MMKSEEANHISRTFLAFHVALRNGLRNEAYAILDEITDDERRSLLFAASGMLEAALQALEAAELVTVEAVLERFGSRLI